MPCLAALQGALPTSAVENAEDMFEISLRTGMRTCRTSARDRSQIHTFRLTERALSPHAHVHARSLQTRFGTRARACRMTLVYTRSILLCMTVLMPTHACAPVRKSARASKRMASVAQEARSCMSASSRVLVCARVRTSLCVARVRNYAPRACSPVCARARTCVCACARAFAPPRSYGRA
eukprot:2102121-Pleurochrysis_carterae.AAC.6